jgi:hypothetical protein
MMLATYTLIFVVIQPSMCHVSRSPSGSSSGPEWALMRPERDIFVRALGRVRVPPKY